MKTYEVLILIVFIVSLTVMGVWFPRQKEK